MKYFWFILLLLMIFLFSGCSSQKETVSDDTIDSGVVKECVYLKFGEWVGAYGVLCDSVNDCLTRTIDVSRGFGASEKQVSSLNNNFAESLAKDEVRCSVSSFDRVRTKIGTFVSCGVVEDCFVQLGVSDDVFLAKMYRYSLRCSDGFCEAPSFFLRGAGWGIGREAVNCEVGGGVCVSFSETCPVSHPVPVNEWKCFVSGDVDSSRKCCVSNDQN